MADTVREVEATNPLRDGNCTAFSGRISKQYNYARLFVETKAMSISIELKPEVGELLEQEAAAKGVSVESYVEELIDQQVSQPHKTSHIGSEEIDQALDSLAKGSDDQPVLLHEAYSRESIYQDHNCCATSYTLSSCSGYSTSRVSVPT
jgi:hypothetical protein